MPTPPVRSALTTALVWAVVSAVVSACAHEEPAARSGDSADAGPAAAPVGAGAPAAVSGGAWTGAYQLRGTLDKSRQASGTLTLQPLASGAAGHADAEARVRQTYPAYAGPYYAAELALIAAADTLRGTLSCAHGPATPPNLVCHPTTPLRGLENATLVMQPGGRALLTGSHGEGVSVEYGRLNWTAGTT